MPGEWKQSLKQDGYCHLRGIVPEPMTTAARDEIYRLLAEHDPKAPFVSVDPKGSEAINGLLRNSPAADYVEQALGWANVDYQREAQVPFKRARETTTQAPTEHHIDGFFPPDCFPFAMLVGIFLTRTPHPYAGNFTVWPGSHYLHERYFRERTPEAMKLGMPKVDVGEPRQLLTDVGDVVLCHFQLAHGAVVNTSDTDRVVIYFRVWTFIDHWRQLTNLWDGWKI